MIDERLGKAFRALPADEQRRHAIALFDRADEVFPRCKRLWLSIVSNYSPPAIEHHRRQKGSYLVAFDDWEQEIAWITQAYSLGYTVFYRRTLSGWGGGPWHPCDARCSA